MILKFMASESGPKDSRFDNSNNATGRLSTWINPAEVPCALGLGSAN